MRKRKSNLVVSLLCSVIIIISIPTVLYLGYNTAMEYLYELGVQNQIKQTKECRHFVEQYVEEMKKKKEGHPNEVINQARRESCRK